MARKAEMVSGGNTFLGGGDGSYVQAERLKEADIPMESTFGALNGAVMGAGAGLAGSLAVSFLESAKSTSPEAISKGAAAAGGEHLAQFTTQALTNLKNPKHLIPIAATSVALGAFGALARNRAAVMHNEWAERQFNLQERRVGIGERPEAEDTHSSKLTREREDKPERQAGGR